MRVLCGLVLLAAASVAQTSPRFGRGVWRGQDVEFRVLDGWAVFQGDIIIGRAAEMAARHRALLESPDETARGKLRHSIAVADSLRYWPRGVIPYEIDPGFQDTSNIDYAVKYWNENTAVRLVPRNGELNYVRFTR